MTEETFRRDESTHPRTGDPRTDVQCSRSHSFWRLDRKANKIKPVPKTERKRLLAHSDHEELKKTSMSGDTSEECMDLAAE